MNFLPFFKTLIQLFQCGYEIARHLDDRSLDFVRTVDELKRQLLGGRDVIDMLLAQAQKTRSIVHIDARICSGTSFGG